MHIKELERVKAQIVGRTLKPAKIAKLLENAIGRRHGLVVTSCEHKDMPKDEMTVSAYFDPLDWDEHINVELVLIYGNNIGNGLKFDEDGWSSLSFRVFQAVEHENIHRNQYKKRQGLKPYSDCDYFSDPDEIDAHGHDIALELLHYGYSIEEAINKLKNYSSINLQESITLFSFLVYISYDTENKTMKKLIHRTIKYLRGMEDR